MASVLQRMRRSRGPSPATQPAYEAIVLRIADGHHVDESEIAAMLEGRKVDDLQKDVQRLFDRRRAIVDLAAAAEQEKQHKAMLADVRAAQAAIEALPIFQAMRELETAQIELEKLRDRARTFGATFSAQHSRAMWLLQSTASKSIEQRTSDIQGEIKVLDFDRQKLALSKAEVEQRESALREIAQLPKQIAALKQNKSPEAAAESAALTARLVSLKHLVADFAERSRETERLTKEIAKLEAAKEETASGRMVPEQMEFTSKPAMGLD